MSRRRLPGLLRVRRAPADSHAEMLAIATELERVIARRRGPRHSGRLLGSLLVARGLLVESELDYALARQAACGGRLGEVVVGLGLISDHALVEMLAEQLKIEVLDLTRTTLDVRAGAHLREAEARRLAAVPIRAKGGSISVAVVDPTLPDLVAELTHLLQAPVHLYMTTQAIFEDLMRRVYGTDRPDSA